MNIEMTDRQEHIYKHAIRWTRENEEHLNKEFTSQLSWTVDGRGTLELEIRRPKLPMVGFSYLILKASFSWMGMQAVKHGELNDQERTVVRSFIAHMGGNLDLAQRLKFDQFI